MKFLFVPLLSFLTVLSFGQETDTTIASTLSYVEVNAYGQVRRLKDVPAAVGFVNGQTLNRFGTAAVVQAVNTVAGVRMEERSPGSYRFNIRGSSLRSPFGVRNVKVYFNDIPFTDPGGHTYLNGLGYYNFGSIEILKSPGSSLYGAGTGGVLLIESLAAGESATVSGEYGVGSYGMRNAFVAVGAGNAESKSRIGLQHQTGEGYRYHSELRRTVLSWTGNYRINEKQTVKTTFLYSDHFYETPGALTLAEFKQDPKLARPAGGGFPGAEQSRASVSQKTFVAGASFTHQFSEAFSNQSIAYGAYTELRNPTIRNYGKSMEPHAGGRSVFTYKKQWSAAALNVALGGEVQQNFTTSSVYKNKAGNPDTLQTEDDIHIRQSFGFLQTALSWQGWELTAGASINGSHLQFRRSAPAPIAEQKQTLNNELTPRLALARSFQNLTIYTSVSKGFSPPTSAELLPSGSAINLSLQAEQGINYDFGARGMLIRNLSFDVNTFYFRLKNTIVQRRDAGGGDYFINAGKTAQKGIETSLNYTLWQNHPFFRNGAIWLSHTYHHFRYKEFKQLTADFSGKALPGVAPHTVSSGLELSAKNGLLAYLTYFFSDRIPLNDANAAYADAFHVLGAKVGYEKQIRQKNRLRLVIGADNLLDQKYSLGNDVNAFGGRYYNAAAGRNFYASLILQLRTGK